MIFTFNDSNDLLFNYSSVRNKNYDRHMKGEIVEFDLMKYNTDYKVKMY